MTEAEWLNSTHAGLLFRTASQRSSERKVRLFVCACARHILSTDAHPDIPRGVEIAEQMADGIASRDDIERAREVFGSLVYVGDYSARGFAGWDTLRASAVGLALKPWAVLGASRIIAVLSDYEAEMGVEHPQLGLPQLRDIFGNPFRPVPFRQEWRTSAVLALAAQMYESRDFSGMPVLADALQDAGCDNEDVLTHCRGLGPHVRGCWVVDAVLNRE